MNRATPLGYSQSFLVAVLLSFLVAVQFSSAGDAAELKRPSVYLLMGQSNMVGRGVPGPEDRTPHPRVFVLTAGNQWELAIEPLHGSGPKAGFGPGLVFGKSMAEHDTNATIGLVPCAVGATLLKRWEKSGDLYSNAVVRARSAMKSGVLAGVLWHQGEQDSMTETDAASYRERLARMIMDFRRELNAPELPFVVGQIGEFLYTRKKQQTPFAKVVNDALLAVPLEVSRAACVCSTGLTHNGDEVHFDGRSQRELGRRYAAEMIKLRR